MNWLALSMGSSEPSKRRTRTRLRPDPAKAGVRTADLTVTTRDRGVLRRYVPAVRGTVDDPMSRQEVHDKALDLVAPFLGAAQSEVLLTSLWSLGEVKSVSDIVALLQPAQR